ncbi:MAG: M28 family peptidase [Anaerolineae bacterium]
MIFVCFAAEETGKQGSIAFVQDYVQANNIDVRAMINLDMLGSETGPNGEIDRRTVRASFPQIQTIQHHGSLQGKSD